MQMLMSTLGGRKFNGTVGMLDGWQINVFDRDSKMVKLIEKIDFSSTYRVEYELNVKSGNDIINIAKYYQK